MKDMVLGALVTVLILVAVLEYPVDKLELTDYMWVCNKPTVKGSTYCTPQPATDYKVNGKSHH